MSDRQDNNNDNNKKPRPKKMNLKDKQGFSPNVFEQVKAKIAFDEQRGRGHRKDLLGKQRDPQQIAANTAPSSTPITDPNLLNELSEDFGTPQVQVQQQAPQQQEPEKKPEKPPRQRKGTFGQIKMDDL